MWPARRLGSAAAAAAPLLIVSLVCTATPAKAGEGFAMLGVGGSTHGLHSYQGVIYAPWSSLSETGPLVRLWAKSFGFTYVTDLPDSPDSRIDAIGYGMEGDAGWQLAGEWGRAALLAGIGWRDHRLMPSDPALGLEKSRLGLTLTADGEWKLSGRFGVMGYATYLTAFDEYWVQARPYLHLGHGWKIGADVAAFGGRSYDTVRAGLFTTGYELPFKRFGRMFMGGDAGVQSDLSGDRIAPFVGMHAGVLF